MSAIPLAFLFLLIEFFDELHYGVGNAVIPAIRTDLGLSYGQIGLLLGLPAIIGTLIEPFLLLLGDTGLRKRLILGGGTVILISLALTANANSFLALLIAFTIGYPASGAFVSLSQATLMDMNPGREPHMMARWTLTGSIGNLIGPLLVAGGFFLAMGWRWVFAALAIIALGLLIAILPRRLPQHPHAPQDKAAKLEENNALVVNGSAPATPSQVAGSLLRNLKEALHNFRLLRWIALLNLSDLLLDVLTGYTPLYLIDVVGANPAQASVLLSVCMLTSLGADLALIPILERIPGRMVVRISATISALLYTLLLTLPWPAVKITLLILLRFTTLGWYSVLQGEAYASVPGRSGTVTAIGSASGLLGGGLAWLVGWVASMAGLPMAMWLLLLGPVSLAMFVPRPDHKE